MAGIVVFHPDPDHLSALADTLSREADRLVVFLNSDIAPSLRERLAAHPRVTLLDAPANLGIGAGLNGIVGEALWTKAGAVALFDQDSSPPAGLLARLRAAWVMLEAEGHTPGVVSPILVAPPQAASKPPRYWFQDAGRAPGLVRPVAFVPTSGSLIATDVLRRIGLFRADYFIDGIDLEWSFRAAAQGYGSWVDTTCAMPHSVGAGTIGSRRLGWRMPKQQPFRMYCVLRNTLYGVRLRHIPLRWKMKQLAYLPVQMGAFALHHRFRWPVLTLLLRGLRDGLAGRLGPPPRAG